MPEITISEKISGNRGISVTKEDNGIYTLNIDNHPVPMDLKDLHSIQKLISEIQLPDEEIMDVNRKP